MLEQATPAANSTSTSKAKPNVSEILTRAIIVTGILACLTLLRMIASDLHTIAFNENAHTEQIDRMANSLDRIDAKVFTLQRRFGAPGAMPTAAPKH